jgi:uncharacterized membrane protein YgaE (UPF0421/DUF939 family)
MRTLHPGTILSSMPALSTHESKRRKAPDHHTLLARHQQGMSQTALTWRDEEMRLHLAPLSATKATKQKRDCDYKVTTDAHMQLRQWRNARWHVCTMRTRQFQRGKHREATNCKNIFRTQPSGLGQAELAQRCEVW